MLAWRFLIEKVEKVDKMLEKDFHLKMDDCMLGVLLLWGVSESTGPSCTWGCRTFHPEDFLKQSRKEPSACLTGPLPHCPNKDCRYKCRWCSNLADVWYWLINWNFIYFSSAGKINAPGLILIQDKLGLTVACCLPLWR